MTNLDEHMEEHLNAKKLEEERLAAEKATQGEFENMHYRAQQDNERFDRIKLRLPILSEIVARLRDVHKGDVGYSMSEGEIWIDGLKVDLAIEDEHVNVSAWRARKTGKLVVVVNPWGGSEKRRYPPTKGGHSYLKIAAAILEHHNAKLAKQVSRSQGDVNRRVVNALAAKLGMETYQHILTPTDSKERPVLVEFKIKGSFTVEQAEALVLKLRDAGFKADY